MKEIVLKRPAVVGADEVASYPVIGFHSDDGMGIKGWFQPIFYRKDKYILPCVTNGVSTCNGWRSKDESELVTLKKGIDWALTHNFKLYLFENERELFRWLAD